MQTVQEIEERIDELKWRSLSPFEKLTLRKEAIKREKFRTKQRERQMRWYVISSKGLIVILALMIGTLVFFHGAYSDLFWFFLFVFAVILAQNIELSLRLGYLREVRFLKKILKNLR